MVLAILIIQIGLVEENMLHPLDSFTGDCFDKGEFSYSLPFPLFGLSPGWVWWGATDWLTAEVDIECLLGGVPSFNFRSPICSQRGIRPQIAFETMFQYLPKEINQLEGFSYLNVFRKGVSWYNRINASWRMTRYLRLHLSVGGTYCQYLQIENDSQAVYFGKEFHDLFDPAISLGFDWRMSEKASFHITGSYGVTFIYLDNIPRKYQLCYGLRLAPFIKSRWGFLRNFRVEFSSINFYLPDAKKGVYLIAPIYPYLYWQWGGRG